MALDNENSGLQPTLPLAPAGYGGYGYPMMGGFGGFGNGFGFGGDGSWLLLLILLCNGGWGGGMFGGFGGGLGIDFPWLLNGQNQINANTNAGFDHAATQSALGNLSTAVTSGFGDVQLGIAGVNQNICSTGSNITAAVTNAAAQGEIAANGRHNSLTNQLYNNEINSLNRSFAEQTANTAGFNAVQGQLAQCCCDNRLETVQTQGIVQSEAAATRAANAANTQAILDKLCALELDGVKSDLAAAQRENVALQNQLNMAAARADTVAQTSALIADNTAQTQYIVNRVAPYPIPAYPVSNPYGCGGYGYNGGFGWNNGFGNVGFGNGSF